MRPIILGLTASPVQATNVSSARKSIAELQRNMLNAEIFRSKCDDVTTSPVDEIKVHVSLTLAQRNTQTKLAVELNQHLSGLRDLNEPLSLSCLSTVDTCSNPSKWQEYYGVGATISNDVDGLADKQVLELASKIKSTILDMRANYLLGPLLIDSVMKYGTVSDIINKIKDDCAKYSRRPASTSAVLNGSERNFALKSCSSQFQELYTRLLSCPSESKILVFVETRDNAKMLHKLLSVLLPEFRSSVVVGQNGFDGMQWEGVGGQKDAIALFATGACRLLVCTSVLEEGLDVSTCDTVFCLGGKHSLIQSIQRRGRARAQNGTMTIIFTDEEKLHLESVLNQENILDAALSSLTVTLRQFLGDSVRDFESGDATVVQSMRQFQEGDWSYGDRRSNSQFCVKFIVASISQNLQQGVLKELKTTTVVSDVHKIEVFSGQARSHALSTPHLFNNEHSVILASGHTSCKSDFLKRFAGLWDFKICDRPATILVAHSNVPRIESNEIGLNCVSLLGVMNVSVGQLMDEKSFQLANRPVFNYQQLEISPGKEVQLIGRCSESKSTVILSIKVTTLGSCVYASVDRKANTITVYFILSSAPRIVIVDAADYTERISVAWSRYASPLVKTVSEDLALISQNPVMAIVFPDTAFNSLADISDAVGLPVLLTNITHFTRSVANSSEDLMTSLKQVMSEMHTELSLSDDTVGYIHSSTLWLFATLCSNTYTLQLHSRVLRHIVDSIESAMSEHGVDGLVFACVAMQQLLHILSDTYLWTDAGSLFDSLYEAASRSRAVLQWRKDVRRVIDGIVPTGYKIIRRMELTPSRIILRPSLPIMTNRWIRKYGDAYTFAYVYFCDEQGQNLFDESIFATRFDAIMSAGFDIYGEHWEFVACSNSQLRAKTAVFVQGTSEDVLKMRDSLLPNKFKETLGTAKYMNRLGLFLTADRETIELPAHRVKSISDMYTYGVDKSILTDGSGFISGDLLREVCPAFVRTHDECPSALQFRYRGCKGIVLHEPRLDGTAVSLELRASQKKFDSSHMTFCVVNEIVPNPMRLNREIINLLCSLAVGQSVWSPHKRLVELQDIALQRLAKMLTDQSVAFEFLSHELGPNIVETLQSAQINVLTEPFWLTVLQSIYYEEVKALRKKTHIPIDNGTLLTGVPDPTGLLKDGEIFVLRDVGTSTEVILGDVIIYRNPCLDIGDCRIVTAVDIPSLHICHRPGVFFMPCSSSIRRSLSAECSGGDLDGDMFSIIWDRELIPPRYLEVDSLDYAALGSGTSEHSKKQTEAGYIVSTMCNGMLGRIALLDLAVCDILPKGAREELAREVAKEQSKAVDFPKTGIRPTIPEEAKKLVKATGYPDLMEKGVDSYESTKTLGELYRTVCSLTCDHNTVVEDTVFCRDEILSSYCDERCEPEVQRFYEMFELTVRHLMIRFGLKSEAELMLGRPNEWNSEFGSSHNKVSAALKDTWNAVKSVFQDMFVNLVDCDDSSESRWRYASTWYQIAYHDDTSLHSFAWVISDVLCALRRHVLVSEGLSLTNLKSGCGVDEGVAHVIGTSALSCWKSNTLSLSNVIAQKKLVFDRVVKSIHKSRTLRDTVKVVLYGSVALLLCDTESDLDVHVRMENYHCNSPLEQLHLLKTCILDAVDGDSKGLKNAESSIPIIKLKITEGSTTTSVDICAKQDGVLKSKYIRSLYAADQCVLPLFACVKQWAQYCGLLRSSAVESTSTKRTPLNSGQLQALILHFLGVYSKDRDSLVAYPSTRRNRQDDDLSLIAASSTCSPQLFGGLLIGFFNYFSTFSGEFSYCWPITSESMHQVSADDMYTVSHLAKRACHLLAVRRDWRHMLTHCVPSEAAAVTLTYTLSRAISETIEPNLSFFTGVLEHASNATVSMTKRNKSTFDSHIVVTGKGNCYQIQQLRSAIISLAKDGRAGTFGRIMSRASNYFMENSTFLTARNIDSRSAMFTLKELHKHNLQIQKHHKLRAISRLVMESMPCDDWIGRFCTEFTMKTISQLAAMTSDMVDNLCFAVHFGTFYMVDAKRAFDKHRGTVSCADVEYALIRGRRNRQFSTPDREFVHRDTKDNNNANPSKSTEKNADKNDNVSKVQKPEDKSGKSGGNGGSSDDYGHSNFNLLLFRNLKKEKYNEKVSSSFISSVPEAVTAVPNDIRDIVSLNTSYGNMSDTELKFREVFHSLGFSEHLNVNSAGHIPHTSLRVTSAGHWKIEVNPSVSYSVSAKLDLNMNIDRVAERFLSYVHGTVLSAEEEEGNCHHSFSKHDVRIKIGTSVELDRGSELYSTACPQGGAPIVIDQHTGRPHPAPSIPKEHLSFARLALKRVIYLNKSCLQLQSTHNTEERRYFRVPIIAAVMTSGLQFSGVDLVDAQTFTDISLELDVTPLQMWKRDLLTLQDVTLWLEQSAREIICISNTIREKW